MNRLRIVTGLLVLSIMLALVPASFAQDMSFGLSPEDMAALQSAIAMTSTVTSAEYSFALDLTVSADGEDFQVDLAGSGVFEMADPADPLFQLLLSGQAVAEGETTPLNAEVRVVNGSLYLTSPMLGMPQWIAVTPEDLTGFSAMLPVDPEALASGDLSQLEDLGLTEGMGEFGGMMDALNAEDIEQYVSMSRSGDVFLTTLNFDAILTSPELQDALIQDALTSGEADMSEEEMRQMMAQLPQALEGTMFTMEQHVSNGMVSRIVINGALNADPALLGEVGDPIHMAFSFDAGLSGAGGSFSVGVPEQTIPLAELMGGMGASMGS